MRINMRKIALAVLLAGAPGLAFAADNGWQAQVGEALGKTGARRRPAFTALAFRVPI